MRKSVLTLIALFLVATFTLGGVSAMASDVLYGDVNGDGRINNKDLGLFQQYLAGWGTSIDLTVADVNDDGRINNKDLGLFQQYLAGWDVTLGPDEPVDPPVDPDEPPVPDDNRFNDTTLEWN